MHTVCMRFDLPHRMGKVKHKPGLKFMPHLVEPGIRRQTVNTKFINTVQTMATLIITMGCAMSVLLVPVFIISMSV